MTYLIIRQKTYFDKSKFYSVHDHTEDKDMALDKVRGYTLANSEKDIKYFMSEIKEPLSFFGFTKDKDFDNLKNHNVVKSDNNFNYSQLELPFPEVE